MGVRETRTVTIPSTVKKVCYLNDTNHTVSVKLAGVHYQCDNENHCITLICSGIDTIITVTVLQPDEAVEVYTLYSGVESSDPNDLVKKT
jgi:hypothetical protein